MPVLYLEPAAVADNERSPCVVANGISEIVSEDGPRNALTKTLTKYILSDASRTDEAMSAVSPGSGSPAASRKVAMKSAIGP